MRFDLITYSEYRTVIHELERRIRKIGRTIIVVPQILQFALVSVNETVELVCFSLNSGIYSLKLQGFVLGLSYKQNLPV